MCDFTLLRFACADHAVKFRACPYNLLNIILFFFGSGAGQAEPCLCSSKPVLTSFLVFFVYKQGEQSHLFTLFLVFA